MTTRTRTYKLAQQSTDKVKANPFHRFPSPPEWCRRCSIKEPVEFVYVCLAIRLPRPSSLSLYLHFSSPSRTRKAKSGSTPEESISIPTKHIQQHMSASPESSNHSLSGTDAASEKVSAFATGDIAASDTGTGTGKGQESQRDENGTDRGDDDDSNTIDNTNEEEDDNDDSNGSHSIRHDNDDDNSEDAAPTGIAATEVKNIILQVLSPYFDDDGGGPHPSATTSAALDDGAGGTIPAAATGANANGAGGDGDRKSSTESAPSAGQQQQQQSSSADGGIGNNGIDDTDTAQRYDHETAQSWVQLVCDGIMERLVAMGRPYKFVTHFMVMRKCGAGMHVCSSNVYSATDGWLSHAHDLSPHIYAVVTVYWMAI